MDSAYAQHPQLGPLCNILTPSTAVNSSNCAYDVDRPPSANVNVVQGLPNCRQRLQSIAKRQRRPDLSKASKKVKEKPNLFHRKAIFTLFDMDMENMNLTWLLRIVWMDLFRT